MSTSANSVFRSGQNKDEQDLPVRQQRNAERRFRLRRKAKNRREQSLRAVETSPVAQKRLEAERQRGPADGSVKTRFQFAACVMF